MDTQLLLSKRRTLIRHDEDLRVAQRLGLNKGVFRFSIDAAISDINDGPMKPDVEARLIVTQVHTLPPWFAELCNNGEKYWSPKHLN